MQHNVLGLYGVAKKGGGGLDLLLRCQFAWGVCRYRLASVLVLSNVNSRYLIKEKVTPYSFEMHVPLDEHLHSEECNIIIRQLQACHAETSLTKQFLGECNKLDWAMRACTKKERLKLVEENRAESKERIKKVQERMATMEGKDWRENLREKLDAQKD